MTPILIIDDEVRFRELYGQVLAEAGFAVTTAGSAEEARRLIDVAPPALVVSDVRLPGQDGLSLLREVRPAHPGLPFLLVTAYADVRDAVEALKLGAVDYLAKPVDLEELLAAVRDGLGLAAPEAAAPGAIPAELRQGLVVESPAFRAVVQDAWRVARSDATVLLTGESGTGKGALAAFIHRASARAGGPFVTVNCGAIPATLVASELFGHERGAFTGAVKRRIGRVQEAAGGTLFLDEIGELPLELQPVLLRVLETGRFTPVGGEGELEADYRLVAATNRDLAAEVAARRFREDLYYRLNVIALEVPPLRERPEDVLPLAQALLGQAAARGEKRIAPATARQLLAHAWPGNVRELANAVERARLLSRTEIILPEHLPRAVREAAPAEVPAASAEAPVPTLEATEREALRRALAETGGNRTRAAALLGITRRGLIYKLKRLGLDQA